MLQAYSCWLEDDSELESIRAEASGAGIGASYKILSEKELGERQQEAVACVVSLLSVSRGEAFLLLLQFNWSVEKVNEEWFADEEKVRSSLGLFHKADPGKEGTLRKPTCGICFDTYSVQEMNSTPHCNHYFCNGCLQAYFSAAVAQGPRCLTLRCAEHRCKAAVGGDLVKSVVSQEDWARYSQCLVRSFVERQRSLKWCPAPGCGYAVRLMDGWDVDIGCKCGHNFCGGCLGEIHRPVDCETVVKWNRKTDVDGGSVNWKLANSKPCPKCKRPIEKDQGCNHMTCPCGHHFCWTCLGPFANYQHTCNSFQASTDIDTDRVSMMRYAHYFERFNTNENSRAKAIAEFKAMDEASLEDVLREKGVLESLIARSGSAPAAFIPKALAQVVEGRRILKWSYAYGYYLLDSESNKTRFFECLQGQAESCLEKLHRSVELELQTVLSSAPDTFEALFLDFRLKLVTCTVGTKNYFNSLVEALENGLLDAVDSVQPIGFVKGGKSKKIDAFKEKPESSRPRKKGKHGKTNVKIRDMTYVNTNQGADLNMSNNPVSDGVGDYWQCSHCTLTNEVSTDCQACGLPRHGGY